MHWLLSKLASQIKLSKSETEDMKHFLEKGSGSNFIEDLFLPEEKEMILSGYLKWLQSGTASEIEFDKSECMDTREHDPGKDVLEIMYKLLTSREWNKSDILSEALKPSLLRLCARYLLKEKKRGKAFDVVANFHLQNGSVCHVIYIFIDKLDTTF
ncbi:hypothetical protein B296_00056185 [Ensete ventricosum]|uniref:Malonyl-CoA decarboxylase C-terminal domain-containing protein n=1 Tax=Ensete ventricosum TaxID=4639 RepID=A0A426XW42_ENSVE|nr:hypothetical protein B296_00056185 [Ensete ventricosum]